jgi:predicted peptidase
MGGYGTWALASLYPDRFAAIAPVCGGGSPLAAPRLKHLPIWAFHGATDDVVPVSLTERMQQALLQAGAEHLKVTIYPDAGHDSWTRTYANSEFYGWLLQQRRRR